MRESIQTRTMRRVVAVYYLRKVINVITLRVGILVLTTLAFGSLVHVAAVFDNMPAFADFGAMYNFIYSAFFSTGIAVQAVVVVLGAVTLWLMKDAVNMFYVPKMKLSHA